MTPVLVIYTNTKAALAWTKNNHNCSLRNEKLKSNRASETEEQRKERLRLRREKDRARTKKKLQEEKKRSSETEDHEKQCLASLKRSKQGDKN